MAKKIVLCPINKPMLLVTLDTKGQEIARRPLKAQDDLHK